MVCPLPTHWVTPSRTASHSISWGHKTHTIVCGHLASLLFNSKLYKVFKVWNITQTHSLTQTHTNPILLAHTHTYILTLTHIHIHIHTLTHTYISHTHIHNTHTHTHTWSRNHFGLGCLRQAQWSPWNTTAWFLLLWKLTEFWSDLIFKAC